MARVAVRVCARARHLDRNAHQAANLERLAHQLANPRDVERLEQVVERAQRHRLDRRVAAGERRDENDRQLRVRRAQLLEQFEAGRLRQQNVEQHDVGLRFALQPQTFFGRRGGNHFDVAACERLFDQMPHGTIVVDDKNSGHGSSLHLSSSPRPD